MSSSDEASDKECPLCMETLELDDLTFFPCKCEYQICRFCWHRIKTDENGLCPACRSIYPDNPVNFQAMTCEDVVKFKEEKRLKKQAEKLKISDARQYLCNYRVLQKNLVYVVGLSPRVADPEVLKKNEYFGRYGKIQKIVTSVTPSLPSHNLPPSHTAYVTYKRVEDALRAIQGVHNSMLDGRVVKASLGTTKYCSSFLGSRKCHKPECMYLHENAEPEISFTKEDMHLGKHTEYERRLIEAINSRPAPPQSILSTQLDKILTPSVNSAQNKRPATETIQDTNGSNAVTGVERTGSAAQIPANEPEADEKLLTTNDVGPEPEEQDDNVAQFQSVEDPTPSDPADESVNSRRSNATARERQWSERDQISVAPSNSPPTDPEAHELEIEDEDINRSNISDRLSNMEIREDRLDRSLPYSDHDYHHTGIPAPAQHQEAPAPLMQWGDLLGLTTHQPAASTVVEPSSLFSSFKLDTAPAMFSTQTNVSNSFRREPSPPPGLPRFNSDDDLGFDPFTESSKGLSELLQEEQEQIPPHNSSGHSLDVLKHSRLFGQMPEQRHQAQHSQQHQQSQQQLHHHPLQQHQDQHHSFLQQLHSQQQQHQQFADMSRQDFFSRMMHSQMQQQQQQHQHHHQQQQQQQSQRTFDSAPGFGHPFANMQQHQSSQQPQQQQHPSQSSQSSSLLQDLFNRQQQQQQAQQAQQQQQQMYHGMNSFMYNDMMYPRVPFGMTPPPGLQAPSANRSSAMQPPHLAQSSMQQQSQSQQQQQSQQQSMGLFGMGHSLLSQQHPPQQSAQDAFKALLPNVNVRFMDDNSMTRWSHENSLRSAAVAPPPGFSSMVNR